MSEQKTVATEKAEFTPPVPKPLELAQAIKENMQPRLIDVDGAKVLVYPQQMQAKNVKSWVDEHLKKPERRKGQVTLDRLQSFTAIVNRFKNDESALFAEAQISDKKISAGIKAVFDYHPSGNDVTIAENMDHTALYKFPISKDFAFWMENNGTGMSQIEFALFLEERVIDMASPTQADRSTIEGLKPKFAEPIEILELSRNLELYSNETFQSKNKLSSGETEFKFSAVHVDSSNKPVSIPDFFIVQMPIFEGGVSQRILVRLRYRLNSGTVKWFYDLYRIDNVLEKAFEADCAVAQEATGLPLFFGNPEQKNS